MANAAITFVYNEAVNLPIWIDYYGKQFGLENLFIIDRSSNDGSTQNLGAVNVIRVPRNEFDEFAKTSLMSHYHAALTSCYDSVIITDCDELLVPDPDVYQNLADYVGRMENAYANAIGIDIIHVLNEEGPLDFSKPILSQRSFGRFHTAECKQLISRVPVRWLPGLHESDKKPSFDEALYLFHIKLMDYGSAVARQAINLSTKWSEDSLARNLGAHHRYDLKHFVHQSFLIPIDVINRRQVSDFEFSEEIARIEAEAVQDAQGYYRISTRISKYVKIPDRFSSSV